MVEDTLGILRKEKDTVLEQSTLEHAWHMHDTWSQEHAQASNTRSSKRRKQSDGPKSKLARTAAKILVADATPSASHTAAINTETSLEPIVAADEDISSSHAEPVSQSTSITRMIPSIPASPTPVPLSKVPHFYLHNPRPDRPMKQTALIPLAATDTLGSALRNRVVLEYPTIYVLPLREDELTEEKYVVVDCFRTGYALKEQAKGETTDVIPSTLGAELQTTIPDL